MTVYNGDDIESIIHNEKNENKKHLSKFDDIDLFLKITNHLLIEYFNNQSKYKDFDLFLIDIKNDLLIYVNCFKLTRKEKKLFRNKLEEIKNKYHELIYYGEYDTIEARKIRNEEKLKLQPQVQEVIKNSSSKVLDLLLFRKKS